MTTVIATCVLLNPANQQLQLCSRTLSHHLSPISSGRRRVILPPGDRAERKTEELPSFLQWRYYQIAWCKKLLPLPSHYVYLARSQYVERFSDSATEAAFFICTTVLWEPQHHLKFLECQSLQLLLVGKSLPTEQCCLHYAFLLTQVYLGQAQTVFSYW